MFDITNNFNNNMEITLTFDEVLNRKEWLHAEIMRSLGNAHLTLDGEKRTMDIGLVINGVTVSPNLYNGIMNEIEKVVDREAANLVKQKIADLEEKFALLFTELQEKMTNINELMNDVSDKIVKEFNLDLNE